MHRTTVCGFERPSASPALRLVLALPVWLAVAACTSTESVPYARVELTGWPQPGQALFIGEPITVEIRWFDAEDNPVEPSWFQWMGVFSPGMGAGQPGSGVTHEESLGVRRATLVPWHAGRHTFEAFSRKCSECGDDVVGPIEVWVSARASELHVLNENPTSMVPGERRPFAAIPAAPQPLDGVSDQPVWATGEAVTCSVDDSAIAEVDAHCLVTAKSVGQTVVRFTTGKTDAELTLNVVEGVVGPPATGVHPILGTKGQTSEAGWRKSNDKTDHTLVITDAGWPVLAVESVLGIPLSPTPVISWTGSGFGVELVGRLTESPSAVSLALDGNGLLYVVCTSGGNKAITNIVLAQRPVAGGPGDWRYRELPARPSLLEGEEVDPWAPEDPDAPLTSGPISLWSPGEGLYVAYKTAGRNPNGTNSMNAYLESLRLARVTNDAVEAEDVQQFEVARERRMNHDLTASDVYIAPPANTGGTPRIVVLKGAPPYAGKHAVVLEKQADGWSQPVQFIPPPEPEFEDLYTYGPKAIAPVLPMPESGSAMWVHESGYPFDLYALNTNSSIWKGMDTVSPLLRTGPYGYLTFDDPAPLLLEPDFPKEDSFKAMRTWEIAGAAVTPGRLHWVGAKTVHDLVYVTVQPPRPALITDPEALGTRLTDANGVLPPKGPIQVLSDGRRMVTLASYMQAPDWTAYDPVGFQLQATQLLLSDGPDKPWRQVPFDEDHPNIGTRWFEADGQLLGWNQSLGGVLEIVRLNSDQTLETLVASMVFGDVVDARVVGKAWFVLVASDGGYTYLHYSPDPIAGEPFQDVLAAHADAPQQVAPRDLALLRHGDEVWLLGRAAPTALGKMVLMRFAADGTLVQTSTAQIPADVTDKASSASVTSDGVLYFWAAGIDGIPRLVRSEDKLESLEIAAQWEVPWFPPTPVVELPDGRLAFGTSWRTSPDIWKAFLMVSDDGSTWAEPVPIRADGGNGQRVSSLTLQGEQLLALLLDNGSMRAYWLRAALDINEYAFAALPWWDGLSVSLPIPASN